MLVNICPSWFRGLDSAIQFLFVIVTGLVALLGIRAYLFFKDERYKLHAFGFALLAASYLVLSLTNCALFLTAQGMDHVLPSRVTLTAIMWLGAILNAMLYLGGLAVLLICYLHIKERTTRALITVLVIFAALLATVEPNAWTFGIFHLLGSALLLFIVARLMQNLHRPGHKSPAAVLTAFSLILLGEVLLALVFILDSQLLYVASYATQLAGFIIILVRQLLLGRK